MLQGTTTLILFPDGWYGRPWDNVYHIDQVDIENSSVRFTISGGLALSIDRASRFGKLDRLILTIIRGHAELQDHNSNSLKAFTSGTISILMPDEPAKQIKFVDFHFDLNGLH
jgi:hypothetical protein